MAGDVFERNGHIDLDCRRRASMVVNFAAYDSWQVLIVWTAKIGRGLWKRAKERGAEESMSCNGMVTDEPEIKC